MESLAKKLTREYVILNEYRTRDGFIDGFPSYKELKDSTDAYASVILKSIYPDDLCSIIIPVFNKIELTKECIDRITSTCIDSNYEIVIVDNGSDDGTFEELSRDARVRYYRFSKNHGIPAALNIGAKLAKGSYLTFMHNDFMVSKNGWLREIVCKMKLVPDAGVSGFCSTRHLPTSGPLKGKLIYCVDGMSMTFSRKIFTQIGGFDEDLSYIGYYDIDICYRLAAAGYAAMVSWSPCRHLNHSTSGTSSFQRSVDGKTWVDLVNKNKEKFMKKWGLTEKRRFCEECKIALMIRDFVRTDICLLCKPCYQKLKLARHLSV